MSSRAAVGSSLDHATPSPILKSTPLTFLSSKLRFGRSSVHSGAKPMPRPADTSYTSEKVWHGHLLAAMAADDDRNSNWSPDHGSAHVVGFVTMPGIFRDFSANGGMR